MAAIGAFPRLGDSTEALSDPATLPHPTGMSDYYEKLGVKKIINAYDTITELTGGFIQRALR